ncbi:multidrug efflux pump subunit AcrA (membrane-fusion protein) [Micromonospora violae]|uniref:Multidrug efflux pump subunit AcrA (Membrane-fusion protein) n=1 Tax=Micromonospora violae TaxID=1278207 RepID=A0A4Q7UPC4_9ACTN|nr:peptidoglycan-binding protein [Micromonospora violae]RZT81623.1 multidrug efflux pump subunit AcrA (membrane-fusion protein) [Micromonospora violae]
MTGTTRRSRLRAAVTGGVVLLVAAVAVVAAVGFGGGPDGGPAQAGGAPPATATVTRQTLADSETADGELGYGTTRTATAKLSGTITGLAATGSTVRRGKALYLVDNEEVVLLYGGLPAYRTLAPGVEGADVAQFERNLEALGYTGFTVDDEYTGATADAVREWQEDLGLPETGRVEPGRIVYADREVRVASQIADVGDLTQPGQAVLTYTGTSRVVTVELDVDDQRLAKRDAKVSVKLPDGRAVAGTISTVETVVQPGSTGANGQSGDAETKIEVTVAVTDPKALTGFDQASADVTFTVAERRDVLTVPVAALLALAEGGYGVQVVEGGASRILAVTTGLFADGRVEVTGTGVTEGATVVMPT